MSVFHYVAHEVKDETLFDNEMETSLETGAIFNDFDASPIDTLLSLEETESFTLSQPMTSTPIDEGKSKSIEAALDNAVMEADRTEGIHYDHLTWDSELFDNQSEECDEAYCQKVYKLVTNQDGAWDAIAISPEAIRMFERRVRTNWSAPDTVFDAWLTREGRERTWFDSHLFGALFPDYEAGSPEKSSEETIEEQRTPKRRRLRLPKITYTTDESESDCSLVDKESVFNDEVDSKTNIKFIVTKPVDEVIVISSDEDCL